MTVDTTAADTTVSGTTVDRTVADATVADDSGAKRSQPEKASRRKIPGNLPYTSSPGVLRRVLDKIPVSEKPSVFTTDFLSTVMEASGGAARPIIPLFKTTGLLSQTGAPTELYAQFQTSGGRSLAALYALKNGFPEIFKRNQYAHRADENALIDIIIAITGLTRTDQIVRYILNTFQAFQEFAKLAREDQPQQAPEDNHSSQSRLRNTEDHHKPPSSLRLVYNINVVLPETTNVEVYNAIFKSLRGNILQ